MQCEYASVCGGCSFEVSCKKTYQEEKEQKLKSILKQINQEDIPFGKSVFIEEGNRRRASFSFLYSKGVLLLGYNQRSTNNIVDIERCPLLTEKINSNIETIKNIALQICQVKIQEKIKKNKFKTSNIYKGNIAICEADNGLDIVIECEEKLNVEHIMIISEEINHSNDIIRISHRQGALEQTETIVEKIKPIIKIADYDIFISAGTFLQASKLGESTLIGLVEKYVNKNSNLKIADLFCGIGTFSYPLSKNKKNKIIAVDSSKSLLDGFQESINKNIISNIEIVQKNLFKYPLDENELKDIDLIIFDPPRAGADRQMMEIAKMKNNHINKIVGISCNPHSFIKDANILIDAGYKIKEITFVDQFTYSNHYELVALFEK